jgi:hypothetical protein
MATAAVTPDQRPRLVTHLTRAESAKLKPQTVDQLAKDFLSLKLKQEALDEEIHLAKERLLLMVKQYGAVPAKADKSKRVIGELYEVTATYGTSTSVDTRAAEQLMLVMIEAGMKKEQASALFESLFTFQPKYALASTALKAICKLPKGAPRNLRALFNNAVKVTEKSPTLSVAEIGAK